MTPFDKNWAQLTYPYVKSFGVYQCPDDTSSGAAGTHPISYAMNIFAGRLSAAKFVAPASTVMLMEVAQGKTSSDPGSYDIVDFTIPANYDGSPSANGYQGQGCNSDNYVGNGNGGVLPSAYDCNNYLTGNIGAWPAFVNSVYNITPRHDPSAEFLAADGHVKLLRPEKVSSGTLIATTPTDAQGATSGSSAAGTSNSSFTLTFSTL